MEQERIAAGELGIAAGSNNDGDDAFGIALRWYAENFNSTEFGLYFQKADSRLPYISYNTSQQTITGNAVGWNASTVSRGTPAAGSIGAYAGSGFAAAYNPLYATIGLNDPHGILADATVQANALAGLQALNGLCTFGSG